MTDTPPSAAYSIRRYLQVRDAFFPDLTADGRHLAFITNITGVHQVWGLALPDEDEPVP